MATFFFPWDLLMSFVLCKSNYSDGQGCVLLAVKTYFYASFSKAISVCLCKTNSFEPSYSLSVHYITLPITQVCVHDAIDFMF
jgi:hypothetical protein